MEGLRPIIGKQRDKDPIECDFVINNHKVSDPSDIANAFSEYSANVGKQLQSTSIPSSKSHLKTILWIEKQKLFF